MTALVVMRPIAAKPSKIVAGLDADKTNEFLQALAEAINKKVRKSCCKNFMLIKILRE